MGWVEQQLVEYNSDQYPQFDSIQSTVKELKSVDPKNPEHTFMYLLHLNREASRLVHDLNHPHKKSHTDGILHICSRQLQMPDFGK